MPYKLSATLAAHTADVRAVTSPTDGLIISASRDATAIAWARTSQSSGFSQTAVLRPGSRYINAVAYIPPAPDAPQGYAVTGGQDTVINVFSLADSSGEPNFSLLGHKDNVCALHTGPDRTLISGSWDCTAKVWKDFRLAYDLIGHHQSVWAVLCVDDRQYLTGSADCSIKLWSQHKNVRTYPGHTQAVRGLALITDIGFASCSNDSEIRIWTMEGDTVYTLTGHTSFVYSISVLPNGDIVSGGEDRTVRIWREGECAQTIVHPAISVWTVSAMPNGDIVSGCSDGSVRIFSATESRWAPAPQLQNYDEQVAAQAISLEEAGIRKEDLPGVEALSQPGTKPGEIKMVRRGEIVESHQWDSANFSWQKIGEVVGAAPSGKKTVYEGKEYDYVFDVDVQEGVPPFKLPYNVTENPYNAAQRFLQAHDLPMTYIDEVVKFIEKNTAGVTIGPSSPQYADPFTGASRYQPPPRSAGSGTSDFMDPFTGSSRYRASSNPAPKPPAATLPVRTPLFFRQANVSAMQSKLYQFDQSLRNEISTSSYSMYPQELNLIDESFVYLTQAVAHPLSPPATPLSANHVDAIVQVLERWPAGPLFPLMDLSRLIIGFCPDAYADPAVRSRLITALFKAAEWNDPWSQPLPKQRETNTLFLIRAFANMFQESTKLGDGKWVVDLFKKLGETPYGFLPKGTRVALATVLFNLSCIALRERLSDELWNLLIGMVLSLLAEEKEEAEAAYRALVALGNSVHIAKEQQRPLDGSQVDMTRQVIANLPTVFLQERFTEVTRQIAPLL
ncbi:hypothetical protein CERSUDRAFT_82424 [Gelatoporia subvermispora B]|uniref:Phospholipase A-2-activating protein n=1 Tax=Ceriporiopsis subvermispora (strain B) TaxID=914234 RepID=M2R0Y6_CERS8|nr:hypothetical protein CERSUDRAFT_82424 [Gelatoporia subvermispora B]